MTRAWLLAAGLALGVAAAGALTLPACEAPAKPAAQRDWTKVVAATPEGGFRMGNPAAKVKLIEYGSLTCSHCAHFEAEGMPPLIATYVKSGKVSFEFRNFIRDPYDMAAALVSRCGPTQSYFPLTRQIFATQADWTGKFSSLSASDYDALEALEPMPKLARIASIAGLDSVAARFGIPASKTKACLADNKAIDRLTSMREAALKLYGLEGTPMFMLNGKKLDDVFGWEKLEPALKQAGG